jgi:hypothetical protein
MKHVIRNQSARWGLAVLLVALGVAGCSTKTSEPNTSSQPANQNAAQNSAQNPGQNAGESAAAPAADGSTASPAGQPSASPTGGTAPSPAAGDSRPPEAVSSAAVSTPTPPPPPPRTFTLASGRSISVYTTAELSTKKNKSGDGFTATLAAPIVDNDWVIAQKGATVEGVVTNSDPGGRVKGVASIAVQLKRLKLADGRTIAISTSGYVKQARTTKKKDATKIGIGAGAGALIGAIAGGGKGAAIGAAVGGGAGTGVVLATRGDPAVIPGESALKFRMTAPVVITKNRSNQAQQ